MSGSAPKNEVRHFYDEIGWKLESDGFYQNARYEDLRPVSADYIHRCHLRLVPYFKTTENIFWMRVRVRSNIGNIWLIRKSLNFGSAWIFRLPH